MNPEEIPVIYEDKREEPEYKEPKRCDGDCDECDDDTCLVAYK